MPAVLRLTPHGHLILDDDPDAPPVAEETAARWPDIGVTGPQVVRDLWQHRDLGTFADRFSAKVPAHGAMLLKVGAPRSR